MSDLTEAIARLERDVTPRSGTHLASLFDDVKLEAARLEQRDVPTLDELVTAEPDKLDKLTDAITNLAALVAPDEAPDPEFDAAPDTPYRIVVEYSDGRVEELDKVAEFRLVDARTNQWLIGLTVADEGQAPVLGRWDHEGNWRKLDARSFERRGW